jgi:hypothetical protein
VGNISVGQYKKMYAKRVGEAVSFDCIIAWQ